MGYSEAIMTEFRFTTNESHCTTYDSPSGTRYTIFRKNPFVVKSEDVEFFRKNHRFEEVGIIEKILPPEPEPTKEDLFKEEINKLKIKKETKSEILKAYLSRKDFVEDLEEDYKISPKVSKKEMQIIKSHFLKEVRDNLSPSKPQKPKKKFDSIDKIKKNIKKFKR